MKYNLDLDRITLEDYKEILKKQNLLPGRVCLLENIDQHFALLKKKNLLTVSQLKQALSSAQKIVAFASASGIPEKYLTILNRESGSLIQKSVSLDSFPDIEASLTSRLAQNGLKNTKEYFESNPAEKNELFCLSDLVRINGVGPVAAKTFYEAGYRSVEDVARADAAEMLEKTNEVNRVRQYYKANLGIKDMQFCIDFAKILARLKVEV